MKCKNCGKEHDGSYGSGRFCSVSCKQKFCNKPKQDKIYKCKFCGFILNSPTSLAGHVTTCKLNPSKQVSIEKRCKTVYEKNVTKNPKNTYVLSCIECGKSYVIQCKLKQYVNGKYSHFCSKHCARVFSAKHVDYTKVSKTLKAKSHKIQIIETRICKWCNTKFNVVSTSKQQCCCSGHSQRYNSSLKYQQKLNLTDVIRKRVQLELYLYRKKCQFSFLLDAYPEEFDFSLIEKYGWYKAKIMVIILMVSVEIICFQLKMDF